MHRADSLCAHRFSHRGALGKSVFDVEISPRLFVSARLVSEEQSNATARAGCRLIASLARSKPPVARRSARALSRALRSEKCLRNGEMRTRRGCLVVDAPSPSWLQSHAVRSETRFVFEA